MAATKAHLNPISGHRKAEAYAVDCPRCKQSFERPCAGVEAIGLITCPCGMTAAVEWRQGRAAATLQAA